MQRTALSSSSSAEIMMTGMWPWRVGSGALSRHSTSNPLIPGIIRSSRMRSKLSLSIWASASSPLFGGNYRIAVMCQPARQQIAVRGVVVDHENRPRQRLRPRRVATGERLIARRT